MNGDNDPVVNCATGACCRYGSVQQIGALAEVLGRFDTDGGAPAEDVARRSESGLYHRLAKGLVHHQMIGLAIPRLGDFVRLAMGPSGAPKEV